MPHDLDLAIRHLRANLSPHPTGDCAKHVRESLDAAGFDTRGHPGAAKDYGPFLERLGFVRLTSDELGERHVGDIRVWQGPASDRWGHVAMWSGSSWLADFAMQTDLPGSSFAGTAVATYRYPASVA